MPGPTAKQRMTVRADRFDGGDLVPAAEQRGGRRRGETDDAEPGDAGSGRNCLAARSARLAQQTSGLRSKRPNAG